MDEDWSAHSSATRRVIIGLEGQLECQITQAIKTLLEQKHLYQSVIVALDDSDAKALLSDTEEHRETILDNFQNRTLPKEWRPADLRLGGKPVGLQKVTEGMREGVLFKIPNVTLVCSRCKRSQPFKPVVASNVLEEERDRAFNEAAGQPIVQVFALAFRCQSCLMAPDVFLLRREGARLILNGRAPIEYVEALTVIPSGYRDWYSRAIVAYQTGQVLAANFLLRTMVEQWVRDQAGPGPQEVERELERYMSRLPQDFKDRFPSLVQVYGELSEDMHAANGSEEVFNRNRARVSKHFDGLQAFDLIEGGHLQ